LRNTPEQDAEEVSLDVSIRIVFDEPIDETTLTSANIFLEDSGGKRVEGYIHYVSENFTLIFHPAHNLAAGETYTLTVTTGVKGLAGNLLAEPYILKFGTAREAPPQREAEPKKSWWEAWEPVITFLTILATALLSLLGYLKLRKRTKMLHAYIRDIDRKFETYKSDVESCVRELRSLKQKLKTEFDNCKLTENHYLIWDRRVDGYLKELEAAPLPPPKAPTLSALPPYWPPKRLLPVTQPICPTCKRSIERGVCPKCGKALS
jgi:hypothetical protein